MHSISHKMIYEKSFSFSPKKVDYHLFVLHTFDSVMNFSLIMPQSFLLWKMFICTRVSDKQTGCFSVNYLKQYARLIKMRNFVI